MYLAITGKRRGCSPLWCERYKEGEMRKHFGRFMFMDELEYEEFVYLTDLLREFGYL